MLTCPCVGAAPLLIPAAWVGVGLAWNTAHSPATAAQWTDSPRWSGLQRLPIWPSLSLSLALSRSIALSLAFSLALFLSLSLSLSFFVSRSLSLSFALFLSLSLFFFLYLCLPFTALSAAVSTHSPRSLSLSKPWNHHQISPPFGKVAIRSISV